MAAVSDPKRESMERVIEVSRRLLDLERRPVPRDQHPKQHGCVRARFVIRRGLDAELRKGLFAEEKAYDAWVRFSNGSQRDDTRPDVHGMAVKLMDVRGPKAVRVFEGEPDGLTQDFVMVDHPTFFVKDAHDYALFSETLLKARGKAPSTIRSLLSPLLPDRASALATMILLYFFPWRLRALRDLRAFTSKRIANPLRNRYFSTTAYRFDDRYMKFSVVPAVFPEGPVALKKKTVREVDQLSYEELDGLLEQARPYRGKFEPEGGDGGLRSEDYLQIAMAESLAREGAAFLFQVQCAADTPRTPMDDPRVEWPERDAPFHTVATLWIPPQVFRTDRRNAFGENLSMSPWHALAAHAPVGEINEIRRLVYERLSDDRHRANGLARGEPRVGDDPDDTKPEG
jgi:hypothetical protein